jgi:hypothetical protein
LDDLIIVPLGIWLLLKIIPAQVLMECTKPSRRMVSSRQEKTMELGGFDPDSQFVGLGCLADLFRRDKLISF